MDVSENSGTTKSSILKRVFHYFHHPFWGTPIFGNTNIPFQTHFWRQWFSCSKVAGCVSFAGGMLKFQIVFESLPPLLWKKAIMPIQTPKNIVVFPENDVPMPKDHPFVLLCLYLPPRSFVPRRCGGSIHGWCHWASSLQLHCGQEGMASEWLLALILFHDNGNYEPPDAFQPPPLGGWLNKPYMIYVYKVWVSEVVL